MSDLIIVDITEKERIFLDGQLNQKEIKGNGKISIKNPHLYQFQTSNL